MSCRICGRELTTETVLMSGLTMCTEGCAERYLNGAPVISETPKMSRKDKRRANLCMADGCDSGGRHDWYERAFLAYRLPADAPSMLAVRKTRQASVRPADTAKLA